MIFKYNCSGQKISVPHNHNGKFGTAWQTYNMWSDTKKNKTVPVTPFI